MAVEKYMLFHANLCNKCLFASLSNCHWIHNNGTESHGITRMFQTDSAKQGETSARAFDDVPGPTCKPIPGFWRYLPGGPYYKVHPNEVSLKNFRQYGPIYREKLNKSLDFIHVCDPEALSHVYRTEGRLPMRSFFRILQYYYEHEIGSDSGLALTRGERWHEYRAGVQQKMLKPEAVACYLEPIAEIADDLVTRIGQLRDERGEVPSDFFSELCRYTTESTAFLCFDKRIGALSANGNCSVEGDQFIRSTQTVFDIASNEDHSLPLYKYIRTPTYRRFCQAQAVIRATAAKYVNEQIQAVSNRVHGVTGEQRDLIPYMMLTAQLTHEQVLGLVSEFFFAGVETTANGLAFLLLALAENLEAQENIYTELTTTIPSGVTLNASRFTKLNYLRNVLKEVYRLYPVVIANGRVTTEDIVLEGYHIPEGTRILLEHSVAGRMEEYVLRHDEFLPERWTRQSHLQPHPFVVMPFGFGPRSCPGRRFAEQEMLLAVVKILQKFRVEFHHGPVRIAHKTINRPASSLAFRFIERDHKQ